MTAETQERALHALRFKCGMLWSQLDALTHVYVNGNPAPGGAQAKGAA